MEIKTFQAVLECTSNSVGSSMFYKDEAGHVMEGNYTAFYGMLLKHSYMLFET